MSRARRAGPVALSLALILVWSPPRRRRPPAARRRSRRRRRGRESPPRCRLAGLDARDLRGPDGRRVGVGRVRRARERGSTRRRPDRARGRLCDVDRLDRDAQGDLDRRVAVSSPGRHLLIANAAGIHAAIADATYSGGFAATGGAIVLRPVGGTPIDAVAWGDATNAFVEGSAAPAPAAGSSIERRPGGAAGNGTDTNDNAADFLVGDPSPQNLASPPTPGPGRASRRRRRRRRPDADADANADAGPDADSDPIPTPTPTPTPSPTPTPTPRPRRRRRPRSRRPRPRRRRRPRRRPRRRRRPRPRPRPRPHADHRDRRRPGTRGRPTVRLAGTLTTDLGAIDSARNGFVQDATDGIALRLDAALADADPGRNGGHASEGIARLVLQPPGRHGRRRTAVQVVGAGDPARSDRQHDRRRRRGPRGAAHRRRGHRDRGAGALERWPRRHDRRRLRSAPDRRLGRRPGRASRSRPATA